MSSAAVSQGGGLRSSPWFLLAAGGISVGLLLFATWQAGKLWGGMESERLSIELGRLQQKVAETQVQLELQRQTTDRLNHAVSKSGMSASVELVPRLQRELLKAQAEINQYRDVIQLEQRALQENTTLLDALSNPGVYLLPMKGTDVAAGSTAYALIVGSSRMLFVASNLPQPAQGNQFQLWVLRRQEPKVVNAGLFSPDDRKRTILNFAAPSMLSDIAELAVTEEPFGGSDIPRGDKLMTALMEKPDKIEEF